MNVATRPENGSVWCGSGANDTDPGNSGGSLTVAVEFTCSVTSSVNEIVT